MLVIGITGNVHHCSSADRHPIKKNLNHEEFIGEISGTITITSEQITESLRLVQAFYQCFSQHDFFVIRDPLIKNKKILAEISRINTLSHQSSKKAADTKTSSRNPTKLEAQTQYLLIFSLHTVARRLIIKQI